MCVVLEGRSGCTWQEVRNREYVFSASPQEISEPSPPRIVPPHRMLAQKVELLSGTNRCSLEACAPLLAAGGPSFIEALLCLYRGRGLHEDALALATEERRVSLCSAAAVRPKETHQKQLFSGCLRSKGWCRFVASPSVQLDGRRGLVGFGGSFFFSCRVGARMWSVLRRTASVSVIGLLVVTAGCACGVPAAAAEFVV